MVVHLGWVDSDLESSLLVGSYCSYLLPNKRVEHPKSKSTKLRCATTMVTLYSKVKGFTEIGDGRC